MLAYCWFCWIYVLKIFTASTCQKDRVSLQLIDVIEGLFGIIIALSMHVKVLKTLTKNKDFYYFKYYSHVCHENFSLIDFLKVLLMISLFVKFSLISHKSFFQF